MDESHATSRGDGRGRGPAFGPTATSAATAPDPEVPAKARRRRFTAEYRLCILKQADACKRPGELGGRVRRCITGPPGSQQRLSLARFPLIDDRFPRRPDPLGQLWVSPRCATTSGRAGTA